MPFGWYVSNSSTNPNGQVGTIPEDGWLYLWLARTGYFAHDNRFQAAVFRFVGSLTPLEFEPMNGVILGEWLWTPFCPIEFPDVYLIAPECTDAPLLAGRVRVAEPSAIESETWGRMKASYRR